MDADFFNFWAERILIATGACWLVLEAVLLVARPIVRDETTRVKLISGVLRTRAVEWNWIPWLFGCLGGHFFGPTGKTNPYGVAVLVTLTLAVLLGDFLIHFRFREFLEPEGQPSWMRPLRNRWYVFIVALIVGATFWAQR